MLTHNHGHYPSTIQQLLDEHSSKLAAPAPPQLSPPPLAAHPAPALGLHSPLFPGPKVNLIHSKKTDYKSGCSGLALPAVPLHPEHSVPLHQRGRGRRVPEVQPVSLHQVSHFTIYPLIARPDYYSSANLTRKSIKS